MASLAILTVLNLCPAFFITLFTTCCPWRGTSFLLARPFPAEPLPRQRVPGRNADVPHLRLVAIKSFFRSRSAIPLGLGHVGGRSARCKLSFPRNAFCLLYTPVVMQRVVKRGCIHPCRQIPPQASNYISITHRCCDLIHSTPHNLCGDTTSPWPAPAPGVWDRAASRPHSTTLLHFCILLCLTFKGQDIWPHHSAAGEAADLPLSALRRASTRVSNTIPTERYMTC